MLARSGPLLPYVDDRTVDRVIGAPHGALVIVKDDCANCAECEGEIRNLQAQGLLADLVFGKLDFTEPGCDGFKGENPWLRDVDLLPYTLLYENGKKVDEFASSSATYLLERAGFSKSVEVQAWRVGLEISTRESSRGRNLPPRRGLRA